MSDPDAAIGFMQQVLDATIKERMEGPDGSVMHAEVVFGDSMLMVGRSNDQDPACVDNAGVIIATDQGYFNWFITS